MWSVTPKQVHQEAASDPDPGSSLPRVGFPGLNVAQLSLPLTPRMQEFAPFFSEVLFLFCPELHVHRVSGTASRAPHLLVFPHLDGVQILAAVSPFPM